MIRGLTDDDYRAAAKRYGDDVARRWTERFGDRCIRAGAVLELAVGDVLTDSYQAMDELRYYAAWSDLLTMDDLALHALVARLAGGCRPDLEAVAS